LLDQLPALPVDAVVAPAQDDDGALLQVVRVVERGGRMVASSATTSPMRRPREAAAQS
jgi:hypothetical protein